MSYIINYWYIPILGMIFITGIIYTISLKGIQIKKMLEAIKLLFKPPKSKTTTISPFASLCLSLSATIGTGNIIGVATAIKIGGPGALLWMIFFSIIGLAVKYAEGYLAIKYRTIKNGEILGGPSIYIEKALPKKYHILAKLFAIFTIFASLIGIGTMTQSNGISDGLNIVCSSFTNNKTIAIFNHEISIISIICGIILLILTKHIIFKSTKTISKICETLVPLMGVIYIICCLIIIISNLNILPDVFRLIIKSAFIPKSIFGGITGYTLITAIINGAQKGIFANEAGLGSTAIALSTTDENTPYNQGLISMAGMLVTTIICILTGLIVIITSSYLKDLDGINITNDAFTSGLIFNNTFSSFILFLCILFFGFTSIVGWNLYGVKSIKYLTNNNKIIIKIYMYIYLIMVFLGTFIKVDIIWILADIFNALMAVPNLIALILLNKQIKKDTLNY